MFNLEIARALVLTQAAAMKDSWQIRAVTGL